MTFDFNVRGSVKITMQGYISDVLRGCENIKGTAPTPAKPDLFQISNETDDPLLLPEEKERFHFITAQLLYLCKRVRPDRMKSLLLFRQQ